MKDLTTEQERSIREQASRILKYIAMDPKAFVQNHDYVVAMCSTIFTQGKIAGIEHCIAKTKAGR